MPEALGIEQSLGFKDVAGRTGLDQHQPGLGVRAVQRALGAAQHLHLPGKAQRLVGRLAERNTVDIDRCAIGDEGIGLDAADGDVRAAHLSDLVEVHVGHVIVDVP